MKRMSIFKTVASCLLLQIFFSACFTIQPVEFKKAENININKTDTGIEMTFDLAMHNPNNWSLRLSEISTEVSIDNLPLGKAGLSNGIRIKRDSDFILPIHAKSSFGDLLNLSGIGLNLLLGNQSATAIIKGNMTLKKFIFRKKIQFEYKEKIDKKVLQSLF
jgi:LEA14-like dessication related protein